MKRNGDDKGENVKRKRKGVKIPRERGSADKGSPRQEEEGDKEEGRREGGPGPRRRHAAASGEESRRHARHNELAPSSASRLLAASPSHQRLLAS